MKAVYDFIALVLGKGSNTLLLLVESTLMARILGPIGFGKWSLIIASAALLNNVFLNWSNAITLRFGCEEWDVKHNLNRTLSLRIPIVLFGILLSLYLILFQPFDWSARAFSVTPSLKWLVFFNLLSLWLALEAQTYMQTTNLLIHQAILMPLATCISIGLLLFFLFCKDMNNVLLIGLGVGVLKSLFWGTYCLMGLKRIRFHWQLPSAQFFKHALLFSFPLIPTLLLGYLSDWGDHILLGFFSNKNAVGLWSTAYQMMLGIISINSVLTTILLPHLSKNAAYLETAKSFTKNVLPTIISLWLVLVVSMVCFFPNLYFLIMGAQFNAAKNIVLILGISILTNAFSNLYGLLFNVEKRLNIALLYNFIMVIINLLLSFLLIPKLGMIGAAIGTCISYLVGHMLYVIDQHYYLKIPINKIGVLFVVVLFIGMGQCFIDIQWWTRIIYSLFSLFLLTMTIRMIDTIQPTLITNFFTKKLTGIGYLIQLLFSKTKLHEYN